MKIKLFNFDITIERNNQTWEQRLIKKATCLAKKDGINLNAADRLNRKINRIKAIRLLRFPYPVGSVYYDAFEYVGNGVSSLVAAKMFVEKNWTDE
jgi:hypothetical protein